MNVLSADRIKIGDVNYMSSINNGILFSNEIQINKQTLSTKIYNSCQFSLTNETNEKITLTYETNAPMMLLDTDISAQYDNFSTHNQTTTFGPSIPNRYVACGSGTNTLVYSSDGITWNGLGTLIFSTSCNCVLWNGSMWVAGGEANNTLAYSYNGLNWEVCVSPFTSSCNGLGWNGSMWVAVGSGSTTIAYSYDGIHWIAATTPVFTTSANAVVWNGSYWVAVGSGNATIATSEDGLIWTTSTSSGFSIQGNGIVWTGTNWIAVGDDASDANTIQYSQDGSNWTSSGTNVFSTGYSVAWNGQIVVAGGTGTNALAYSIDFGVSWTGLGVSTFGTSCRGISRDYLKWIAVGEDNSGNTIAYSYDGINWIRLNNALFSGGRGVAYNAKRSHQINSAPSKKIILGGDDGTQLSYSNNGIVWKNAISTNLLSVCNCVAYNSLSNMWIAGGNSGTNAMIYSNDGITWTGLGQPNNMNNCNCIFWNGIMWMAGGKTTTDVVQLMYSFDGFNWTNITTGLEYNNFYTIIWNGTLWVMGGNGVYTNSLAYSYDGINDWTNVNLNSNLFLFCYDLEWNGTMFVAVGQQNGITIPTIMYSYNGIDWNIGVNGFSKIGYGIAWNGTMWVAVGYSDNTNILYSYDGINWQNIAQPDPFQDYENGRYATAIVWVNNMWIATGTATNCTIAHSYNGINWFNDGVGASSLLGGSTITFGRCLGYNGYTNNDTIIKMIHPSIAVGFSSTNTIAYSQDGILWTGLGNTLFTAKGWCVAWNGKMWVAGGEGTNTLAYSYDGIAWTGIGMSVFSTACKGLGWNGLMWIAVGEGTNMIAYSYDGIRWIGLGLGIFSSSGRGVAWNGSMWIAVGDGTSANAIAYSDNGKAWTTSGITYPLNIQTYSGNSIIWTGSKWIVVGTDPLEYNKILSSVNGLTWIESQSGSITDKVCYGISPNETTKLVVVGESNNNTNNTIIYSTNQGSSWTAATSGTFSGIGYGITWNGIRWIAVGDDTSGNNIKYSHDGNIWYNQATPNPIFSSIGDYVLGVASNTKVGTPIVPNQLTLSNFGVNQTNKLDIVTDNYYNTGPQNLSISTNISYL